MSGTDRHRRAIRRRGQRIAFFGSSLVSSYWNGAATYYRGLLKALAERGHAITFYEPDAFERQQHRDMPDPDWARVVVYPAEESAALAMLDRARGADLVVKASGVGVFDELLEREVLALRGAATRVVFWDVDAPATLERMAADPADPFRAAGAALRPGPHLRRRRRRWWRPTAASGRATASRSTTPSIPSTHHLVPPDPRFACDLAFLGNRLPDREERVEEFLFRPAAALPGRAFLLGGSGWDAGRVPANVRPLGHVGTRDHNAFNCTPRAVLNVNRDSMARFGHSPATRLFEAAGAAACLISDAWEGIEAFLEPGRRGAAGALRRRGGGAAGGALARARARDRPGGAAAGARRAHLSPSRRAGGGDPGRAGDRRRRWGVERPPASGRLDLVILGLSITSSWGNGHATTYRGLVRELARRGHRVLFLEQDVPWYAAHRDLPRPPYGTTELYRDLADLDRRFRGRGAAGRRGDPRLLRARKGRRWPTGCSATPAGSPPSTTSTPR